MVVGRKRRKAYTDNSALWKEPSRNNVKVQIRRHGTSIIDVRFRLKSHHTTKKRLNDATAQLDIVNEQRKHFSSFKRLDEKHVSRSDD